MARKSTRDRQEAFALAADLSWLADASRQRRGHHCAEVGAACRASLHPSFFYQQDRSRIVWSKNGAEHVRACDADSAALEASRASNPGVPPIVFGPFWTRLVCFDLLVQKMIDERCPAARLYFGAVDVRDVADLHSASHDKSRRQRRTLSCRSRVIFWPARHRENLKLA